MRFYIVQAFRIIRSTLADSFRALWPAYLLASCLILWGFTWSLPDYHHIDKSFHADENAAIWGVNQIHFPGFNPHLFNWGTALLYQVYVLKLLASLGGLITIGDGGELLLGRFVVWASAMGVLTCVFLLGRELFDAPTGRLAAIVLAVMPGFVINSHYFKTDIPMVFWALSAMVAGYRLLATENFSWIYGLGILTGYAISTKYNAVVMVPTGLVFLAMTSSKFPKFRALFLYGACLAGGFLLGTPRILPDPREFLKTLRWVHGIAQSGTPAAIAAGPAWHDYLTRISQLSLTLPLWAAATAAALVLALTRSRALLPVWVFLAGSTWLLASDNSRLMRYVVPLLPIAALFIAGMAGYLRRVHRNAGRLATLAIAALVVYALLFTASYVRVMTLEDPRIQASRWIAANVSRDLPFPVSTSHSLGAPQVQLWHYRKLDVDTSLEKLRAAQSPYLAVSEYVTQRYDGALPYFPAAKEFFDYVRDHYAAVIAFENSQRLLGIDSKHGLTVTHDWLYPNPRIIIYRRKDAVAATAVRITAQAWPPVK